MFFGLLSAQNVSISSNGDTGTSGTNWSTSGTNPVVISIANTSSSIDINTSVIKGYLESGADVVVEHILWTNNSNEISLDNDLVVNSSSEQTLTFKAYGKVKINDNVEIESTGDKLNLILWSNATAADGNHSTVDINKGASIITNGGFLHLAGGLDNGANGGTSSDGIPDGYSHSYDSGGAVGFGDRLNSNNATVSILTNGGDIIVRGKGDYTSGIVFQDNIKIDSGTGKIDMESNSKYRIGLVMGAVGNPNTLIHSASTSTPAIKIKATSDDYYYALSMDEDGGKILIQSSSATGGGVDIDLESKKDYVAYLGNLDRTFKGYILSANGPINFNALCTVSNTKSVLQISSNWYFGAVTTPDTVQGTSTITNSNSLVTISADEFYIDQYNNKGTAIHTSNEVNIDIAKPALITQRYFYGNLNISGQASNPVIIASNANTDLWFYDAEIITSKSLEIYGKTLVVDYSTISLNNTTEDSYFTIESSYGTSDTTDDLMFFYPNSEIRNVSGNSVVTIKAPNRIKFESDITAPAGKLDVVFWSKRNFTNTKSGLLKLLGSSIATNGGDIWIGGSATTSGHGLWNGIEVGDGPSDNNGYETFSSCILDNADIDTSNGDLMFLLGFGTATKGLESFGTNTIELGTGDFIYVANEAKNPSLTVSTKGTHIFAPLTTFNDKDGDASTALNWTGSYNASNDLFTGNYGVDNSNSFMPAFKLAQFSKLKGITLGYYDGMSVFNSTTSNYDTVIYEETTGAVKISSPINLSDNDVVSDIRLHGKNISITAALNTNGDITLKSDVNSSTGTILTSDTLHLNGAGSFTTGSPTQYHEVNTLFAGSSSLPMGRLTFRNNKALNIGDINSGVNSSDMIHISTQTGNISLLNDINTTSSDPAAVLLYAGIPTAKGTISGGSVILNDNDVISPGRSMLFSGDVGISTGVLAWSDDEVYFEDATSDTNTFGFTSTGKYAVFRNDINIWDGSTSTDANVGSNWSKGSVPVAGDVLFVGTATSGNYPDITSDLNFSNHLVLQDDGELIIEPGVKFTIASGDFNGRPVLFKSSAAGSAYLGTLTGELRGATNVMVERYIAPKRAFRFLSSSVTTSNSLNNHWQENGATAVGLGTHITGVDGATNGFDVTSTNNPSMFKYNNASDSWTTVTNTNATVLTAGEAVRLMIRGDRNIDMSTNTPTATATKLRATGTLSSGRIVLSGTDLNQVAEGYSLIGNPYQAPVDLNSVLANATNIDASYVYYWDSNISGTNGRGGYVIHDMSTNQNDVTGSNNSKYLQVGQSVFVKKANTADPATITFTEADKSLSGGSDLVFRNSETNSISSLRATLKEQTGGVIDGALTIFSDDYSNEATSEDAIKFTNLEEQVSFNIDSSLLGINKQTVPENNSVLELNTKNYKGTDYTWEVELTNYDGPQAYLLDTYLDQQIMIEGTLVYNFNVDTQNAETRVENRFRVVFDATLSNTSLLDQNVSLYPNPTNSASNGFTINTSAVDSLTVHNALGQKVSVNTTYSNDSVSVKPNNTIASGIYIITIASKGSTVTKKWIVN